MTISHNDHDRHALWIGADVSKKTIDIDCEGAPGAFRIDNTPQGFEEFFRRTEGCTVRGVVIEATGGYERPFFKALHARAVAASIVNPARVREFARATRRLAKTDKIDARVARDYGAYMRPAPTPMPSSARAHLKQIIAYRNQVVAEITARKAQMKGYAGSLKTRADSALSALEAEQKALAAEIKALLSANEEFKTAYEILASVPSVGPIVAATLIASLPELGTLSRRQIAALAGLAPFPRDSGERRGHRSIRGGRAEVRHALFNAARVAIRHNAKVKTFYERLTQRGKSGKIALVAAMRKLLTILNAMMKSRQTWTPA